MTPTLNSAVRLLDEATMTLPTQFALEDAENQYDYAQYRDQARRIATGLLQTRKNMGAPIAVLLPKSCEAVIAFMAILYAGCPYVPLDYDISLHRLEQVLENLRPGHIITDGGKWAEYTAPCPLHLYSDLSANPIDDPWIDNIVSQVIDSDPFAIFYIGDASKGVAVSHRGVLDYASWTQETFRLSARTVIANQGGFDTGNALFDIFGALACTGRMAIVPPALFDTPAKLPEFLAERQITCILWHPASLTAIAESGILGQVRIPRLHTIGFSGGVMPNSALNLWRQALPQRTFANLHTPTGSPLPCSFYIVDRPFADYDPLPIGRAGHNTKIVLIGKDNRKAPAGTMGEICLIGSGAPLGAWNAPQLPDANPLNRRLHQAMYRTGDMGMITPEGLMMCMGSIKEC